MRLFLACALAGAMIVASPGVGRAQLPPPSAPAPAPPTPVGVRKDFAPPVTPRRAFFYSLLVPGAGQAALERHFWGGIFFLTEGLSLALVYRSAEDLRLARQFRADSVPGSYQVDATGQPTIGGDGKPVVASWAVSRYSDARLRARRTHYEDWLAVLIFNHLIAGADAFVAAQLWDLPARVGVRVAPNGQPAISASLSFR